MKIIFALASLCACAATASAQTGTPRYEIGVQYSSLTINVPAPPQQGAGSFSPFESRTQPGLGARFTLNLSDSFALEAEGNFFPKDEQIVTQTSGGRTLQGQFGVKAGRRFDKFGIFAKARPGVVNFSRVVVIDGLTSITLGGQQFFTPNFASKHRTYFSTDVGAVAEFYPSRRLVTRFDVGDTIVRYGSYTFSPAGLIAPGVAPPLFNQPSEIKHNLQVSAGVGYRF
ncbi:MAG TPA: outer membrane beta-barrel protein [Pyrinomonadaceae bacterium]|jgi:hypothetical protein|nr:outer membrane beta-barrel protein [Pyrinomonadaceae bacterium]